MKKRNARSRYKRKYIRIERRFIVAEPAASGGFSWTLAAVLGEIILEAEKQFGPRDQSYTILGIDFTPGDEARTWTPGNCKHLIVQLQTKSLPDRHDVYLQLAHEGVHLISPTGKADANVLEEGLACTFEQWYMNYVFGDGWWNNARKDDAYNQAYQAATQLLAIDSNIIIKLRQIEPTIAYISAAQIKEQCPAVPDELAALLTRRFVYTP